jgi:hypothetical protein
MIATCLGALSGQAPKPVGAAPLARGLDGESALRAIMANAMERPSRNATRTGTIGDVNRLWSKTPCNPSTTRSARGCHPCLRYVPLPMSPVRTVVNIGDPAWIRTRDLQLRRLWGNPLISKAGDTFSVRKPVYCRTKVSPDTPTSPACGSLPEAAGISDERFATALIPDLSAPSLAASPPTTHPDRRKRKVALATRISCIWPRKMSIAASSPTI